MPVAPAPYSWRQRVLGFKVEANTGAFEPLVAADAVTPIFNASIGYDVETLDVPMTASMSPTIQELGPRKANIDFETEVYGKGVLGLPVWASLLRGSAWAPTAQVFSPTSSPAETLSFAEYILAGRKRAAGAMGRWTMTGQGGKPAKMKWHYEGVYVAPDTTVLAAAPTYDPRSAPRCVSCALTIGGVSYRIPQFEIECGNELFMAPDVNGGDSGYFACNIVDRAIKVRVSPRAVALTAKDWYAVHLAKTTAAFSVTIGTAAHNKIIITAPKLQVVLPPSEEEMNKLMTSRLEFMAVRTADAGDDEMTIDFATV